MKRFSGFLLIVCALFFLGALAYRFYPKKSFAKIVIEQRLIDIGTRNPDEPTEVVYRIRNSGKTDLIIRAVQANCHCTVPTYTKKPIGPGGVAEIRVRYENETPGYFQQNISVFCNVKNAPVILTLRGKTTPKKDKPAS